MRKLKHNYPHGFAVAIPHVNTQEDGTTSFERTLISTNDPCNHRRVKRALRGWVKHHLGRTLYTHELRLIMKQVVKHKEPRTYMRSRNTVDTAGMEELAELDAPLV